MYSVRRGKTEKIRSFLHRHHRAKHGQDDTQYALDYNNTCEPRSAPPAPRSQSVSPPRTPYVKDLINFDDEPIRANTPPTYGDIPAPSTFSSDYDRYMRIRNMNMERIRELHQMDEGTNNSNTINHSNYSNDNNFNSTTSTTTHSARLSGISSIEQELLKLASCDSPLSSFNPRGPTASTAPISSQLLSPRAELERFRSSFTSVPSTTFNKPQQFQLPTTTTTTTTTSARWSPPAQCSYSRCEAPVEYKTYQQQHDKLPSSNIELSAEHSPNLPSASFTGVLSHDSPSIEDPYNYESDHNSTSLPNSYSDSKPKPISEVDEPVPSYTAPAAPSPAYSEPVPAITVSQASFVPQATVSGVDGKPISLQEDLENLLQNLEDHFKRRPSGIPKAPPPSPADHMSPNKFLGEAIYPDIDFAPSGRPDLASINNLSTSSSPRTDKARRANLIPRSLAFDRLSSPSNRSSSLPSSLSSSPAHSGPSSPNQSHISPAQSDSDYYTPPHSPLTTSNLPSAPQQPHSATVFSPALPPPPPPLSPVQPLPNHNQELDCQGNFSSSLPPPPLPFNDLDLQSLPPPIIPPPDFDYSAYDYQGNRLDRVPENEQIVEQIEEIPSNQQLEPLDEEIEQSDPESSTLHTTSVTTETSADSYGKTVTSTVTSNTSTPTTIFSTVSTATTTKLSSSIPTSATAERDQPTVISTLSTVTTALEPETGKVANARVTQTKVSHIGTECDDEEVSEINKEYNEGFLPSKPPADAFSMSKLLDDIRNGKTLRRTPAPDYSTSAPTLGPHPDHDHHHHHHHHHHEAHDASERTHAALVNVLASRRAYISDEESDVDSDDSEEDDWMLV